MSVATVLKWISGGLEAFLGIPILGGTIILTMAWVPLTTFPKEVPFLNPVKGVAQG